jgi:hypothetical protein
MRRLVRWLLLSMQCCGGGLSGGDEKMRPIGSYCVLGAVIRRGGETARGMDVTKWLWVVCGWFVV